MDRLAILLGVFLLCGLATAGWWGDVDSDGDGLTDEVDDDDDNDGLLDTEDEDDDGDGILDDDEDLDGDGLTNAEDDDDDGDGVWMEMRTMPVMALRMTRMETMR